MKRLYFAAIIAMSVIPHIAPGAEATKAPAKASRHDKVYFFQHRLLPRWVHSSEGGFFEELRTGSSERMIAAATDIVGKEFADRITIRAVPDPTRVLISFAKPKEPPECFSVLVVRDADTFRYFTLEKTEDLFGNGTKSVVGEWTADGGHRNFGPRKYSDNESFMADPITKPKKN